MRMLRQPQDNIGWQGYEFFPMQRPYIRMLNGVSIMTGGWIKANEK